MKFIPAGPEKPKPYIPLDLLEWLEQIYPAKCPRLTDTENMIWHYAGQRAVIEELRVHYDAQERDKEEK